MTHVKKGITITVVSVLFLSVFIIFWSPIETGEITYGNTLYVGGFIPGNYLRIQDAINDAINGDTVYVYSGVYQGNIIVDKSIYLIGEDRNRTVLDGQWVGNVVTIAANGVSINGFTITRSGGYGHAGINISASTSYNNISSNILSANYNAIMVLEYSSHNTITRNTITANQGDGINIYFSNENIVTWNTINENKGSGVRLWYSFTNIITNNTMSSNTLYPFELNYCNNNRLYHNDIFNHILQPDDDGANVWDNGYPSGGNYWSDYTGVDNFSGPGQNISGSDDIGDTPYKISSGGQDRYPLMIPTFLYVEAGGPYVGVVNGEMRFTGNTSGGIPPYTWHWEFGDGSTSTEQNPTHIYTQQGSYTTTCTVTDSQNKNYRDTTSVTIKYMIVTTHGPYIGVAHEPMQFTGVLAGGVSPYQWYWDFGDDHISNEQNPLHTYTSKGNYTVSVTVIDRDGGRAIDMTYATILYRIVWVDDDYNSNTPGWGVDHFARIQDGINWTYFGGTVYVSNGTYYEHVRLNKTINVIGEDKNTTIIDGGGPWDIFNWSAPQIIGIAREVVTITVDHVNISGFTIQHSGRYIQGGYGTPYSGIVIRSNYTVISDNIVKNNTYYGIYFPGDTSHNTLRRNTIIDNSINGLNIWHSSNDVIAENIIEDDGDGNGICLSYASYQIIRDNSIISDEDLVDVYHGISIEGDSPSNWTTHQIINNTLNGKPIRYYANMNNIVVPESTVQVILANCTHCSIQNLTISNVADSIQLGFSSNITIKYNNISGSSGSCISLKNSSYNTILNNTLNDTDIRRYEWSYSNSDGMNLDASLHNTISYNTIKNCRFGIRLSDHSNYNVIFGNILANNNYGINLWYSSDNKIIENIFLNHNYNGIYVGYSDDNHLYHNNFINNSKHVSYYNDHTIWDDGYPSGGNYWDDYNGTDANNDGIGDTPYNISDSKDNYPLMHPYTKGRLQEEQTPGFEFLIVFSAIVLFVFWRRKRTK